MLSKKQFLIATAVVVAIPVIAVAWWLGSPLFIDKEVDEEFPFAAGALVPAGMTVKEVDQIMAGMAKVDETVDEKMSDAMPMKKDQESVPDAVKVKSGMFSRIDRFHGGSGVATIYRGPDGAHVLRFEDFRVDNGPDLRVLLASHSSPGGKGDLDSAGYVELGKLKGNIGNQNYEISNDVDLASQKSVVIYCKPFHVLFSIATLQDAS